MSEADVRYWGTVPVPPDPTNPDIDPPRPEVPVPPTPGPGSPEPTPPEPTLPGPLLPGPAEPGPTPVRTQHPPLPPGPDYPAPGILLPDMSGGAQEQESWEQLVSPESQGSVPGSPPVLPAGHQQGDRLAHVVLNDSFVEDVGADGVDLYLEALVAAARVAETESERAVVEELEAQLARVGIAEAHVTCTRLAGQLVDAKGQFHVSTNDGSVLYGSPALSTDEFEPTVRGTEDPEDPERPVYS